MESSNEVQPSKVGSRKKGFFELHSEERDARRHQKIHNPTIKDMQQITCGLVVLEGQFLDVFRV